DWAVLAGVIGRLAGASWNVPVIEGLDRVPTSDELKHFGAAMASFGSVALFHLVGITPEASRLADVAGKRMRKSTVGGKEVKALQPSYAVLKEVDVVVFSAPQLSIYELRMLATLCDGKRFKV